MSRILYLERPVRSVPSCSSNYFSMNIQSRYIESQNGDATPWTSIIGILYISLQDACWMSRELINENYRDMFWIIWKG